MSPRPKKLQLLRWLPKHWVLVRGPRDRGMLHLTFDDGPNPEVTPRMLDLLAAHRARATFFLIGQQAERHPQVVERIVREGHRIGNHSWSHPHFETLSLNQQRSEIERTDQLLSDFDGLQRHDFRPPRGVMPRSMVIDCIRRRQRIAYWSYDSLDYSRKPVEQLIASARRHPLTAGDVVLLHDDDMLSVRMLESTLPMWSAQGLGFDLLPEAA